MDQATAQPNIDVSGSTDLVVLSVKERAASCRILSTDRNISFRSVGIWNAIPGEILKVKPRRQWQYKKHLYLTGEIEERRIDVTALGLLPLRMVNHGQWNPANEYWGEKDEPIEDWAQPIIERGPRMQFEMEQVLHEADIDDPFNDQPSLPSLHSWLCTLSLAAPTIQSGRGDYPQNAVA